VPITVVAVLAALTLTGVISARLGGSSRRTAVLRVILGGALAMAVTFGLGHLFGRIVS
jgi:VIT1/CCC1 family predicted Fe2+/Mn2+ transporter